MNTTLKLYVYDFLATFSLLTHKIEYDKVHNQLVKKYYLNRRAGVLSRNIKFNLNFLFDNIKIMKLRRLIIIVVVNSDNEQMQLLEYTTIERYGCLLQYIKYKDLLNRLAVNKKPDEYITEFANKLFAIDAAYTLYVFKDVT